MCSLYRSNRFRRMRMRGLGLLCVFLSGFLNGCGMGQARIPETDYQARMGTVAIVAGVESPEIRFKGFAQNKGEGALQGFVGGMGTVASGLGGGGCSGELCGAVVLVELGLIGIGGIVGSVVGVIKAPGDKEMRLAEQKMFPPAAIATLQGSLRDQIVSAATAEGARIVSISPEQAQRAAETGDYRSFGESGVDTVVESSIVRVGTQGEGIDKLQQIYMEVQVRVIRTNDNSEIFTRHYTYLGKQLLLSQWTNNRAEQTVHSLAVGYKRLGAHIYDHVFKLYPFPDRKSHRAKGQAWDVFGLAPIRPVLKEPKVNFFSREVALLGNVVGREPILQWQRFPRETDFQKSPEEMGRVSNVRYDLMIALLRDSGVNEVVYRRDGLPECKHQVEIELKPNLRYAWTVRARFELDGRQRVTEWSSTHSAGWDELTAPTPYSFWFKTQ
ncbi:MAG: hypothetical protein GX455_09810 [Phycisphaerae bacterium]|nr:hypothetical protein [Phycisphaerae bacterium]